jgi:cytochrome c2
MNRFSLPFALILSLPAAGCSNSGSKALPSRHSAPNLILQYGCETCHVIPGVPGAVGKVGPSLESLNQRSYLAGTMSNTPANLQQWIMHPQSIQPGTAMPEMGVTQHDAKEITVFLETSK